MKKRYIIIAILALLLFLAVILNPGKDKFISWAKEKADDEADNVFISLGLDLFGDSLIKSRTEETNYFLFSTFEIDLPNDESIKVLGIYNNFIPYHMPDEDEVENESDDM